MQASKQRRGGLDFIETDTSITSRESNNTVVLFLILSVMFLHTIEPTVIKIWPDLQGERDEHYK